MPAPYAVDSASDPDLGSGHTTTAVSYELGKQGSQSTVTVRVDDAEWLASAVYPIYVDPSITIYQPQNAPRTAGLTPVSLRRGSARARRRTSTATSLGSPDGHCRPARAAGPARPSASLAHSRRTTRSARSINRVS